jgi:tripartite-type tricarboxylate transporter receptor subunit TctC
MLRFALPFAIGFALMAGPTQAQQATADYPNHTVKIIVPSTPGGGTDTFARLVGQALSDSLGQTFYIENRGGGGTLIGMEAAARSAHDGYTLYVAPSTITLLPLVKKHMPVHLSDFAPVTLASVLPQVLIVHPSVPAKTVQEFIALAKKQPGKLTYGSPGIGTGPQMAMQLLANKAGIDLQHIPYKGVANVLTDLLAGRLTGMMLNATSAIPHIQAGTLRALGVTSAKRLDSLKDVPTVAEQGLPGFEALQWFGVLVPAGTPKPIIDKLQQAIAKGLTTEKVKARLKLEGAEPGGDTPEEFAKFLQEEDTKWTAVAKAAHIVPQ